MVSKAMDYALRALTYMAVNPDTKWFGAQELASKADVSRTYLGKILQQLVREGYLVSTTGPGGGFGLARPPEKIHLMELLKLFDGERIYDNCFLGLADCSDRNPCPIHATWKRCREQLVREFENTTVKDAARKSWPGFR